MVYTSLVIPWTTSHDITDEYNLREHPITRKTLDYTTPCMDRTWLKDITSHITIIITPPPNTLVLQLIYILMIASMLYLKNSISLILLYPSTMLHSSISVLIVSFTCASISLWFDSEQYIFYWGKYWGGGGVAIKEGVLYVSYQGKFYVASCNKSGDGAI